MTFHSTMSPTPENGTKDRALAPELESKVIPLDNTRKITVREGPPMSCKTARPLDQDDLWDENDLLDEDNDRGQMPPSISLKRRRLEDGTAQTIRYKQERKSIFTRYGVSYHLNRHRSGVFTVKKQRPNNSGESSKVCAQGAVSSVNDGYINIFILNCAGRSVIFESPDKSTARNAVGIPATRA